MSILLADSIVIPSSVPVDAKYGPYATAVIANAAIPNTNRYLGLTVGIGTTTITEYWYKSLITDIGLVVKSDYSGLSNIPTIPSVPTYTVTTGTASGGGSLSLSSTTFTFNPASIPSVDTLVPTQTNNSGKFLTTNGTSVSWATVSGGGSMTYPVSGIAVSSGTAWGTSLTAPTGTIVGTTDTQTLSSKTLISPVITGAANAIATFGTEMSPGLSSAAAWTLGTGWSVNSGQLIKVTGATGTQTATPSGTFTVVPGVTYKVTIVVAVASSTQYLTYSIGGSNGTRDLTGTIVDYITAQTSATLTFTSVTTGDSVTISSISVVALTTGTGAMTVDGPLTVRSTTAFTNPVLFGIAGTVPLYSAPLSVITQNNNNEGIRIYRANTPSQYLSLSGGDGSGSNHLIQAYGTKTLRIGNASGQAITFYPNNTLAGTWDASGNLVVATATASTSTATGAVQVAGGVGIVGALNVGGAITSNNVAVATVSGTQTLSNKTIVSRVSAPVTTGSYALNSTSLDTVIITPSSAVTISIDGGTPTDGQKLLFRVKDAGTSVGLTFTSGIGNKGFRQIGVTLPSLTVAGKMMYIGCIYNDLEKVWDIIAYGVQA